MKKGAKRLFYILIFAAVLAFTFLASACDFVDKMNEIFGISHPEQSEEKREEDETPEDGGEHRHSLKFYAAKNSTCNTRGNVDYWYCTSCHKYFLSASATQEASSNECFKEYAQHDYRGGVCFVCGDVKLEGGNLTQLCAGSYGYGTLQENQKVFYERLDAAAKSFHSEGDALTAEDAGSERYRTLYRNKTAVSEADKYFSFTDLGLNEKQAGEAYRIYRADHPLYYWLTSSYLVSTVSSSGGSMIKSLMPVVCDEYAAGSERARTNQALHAEIVSFRAACDQHDDAYHKALAYHDAIIQAVDYSYSSANVPEDSLWAHSILGVFLSGTKFGSATINGAVCEGYAKSFQLLLNLSGVNNVYVTGYGGTVGGKGENHAWNLAEIEGKYYWFDLTWDDQPAHPSGIIYDYFCASDANDAFTSSHLQNVSSNNGKLYQNKLYDLPEALFATQEYQGTGILGTRFDSESSGMQYVVCGYNALRLQKCSGKGEVTIPAEETFGGRAYGVRVIGNVQSGLLDRVLGDGVVKVNVPASVRYVYAIAFGTASLREISVADENEFYASEGGVMYTKNKYALVAYPVAREGGSYTLPSDTKAIMSYAFGNCGLRQRNLKRLTVNADTYYVKTLGVGYIDSATAFAKSGAEYDYARTSQDLKNHSAINAVIS